MHGNSMHYAALQCTAHLCTTLYSTAQKLTALHCTASLHCIPALHRSYMQYIALNYCTALSTVYLKFPLERKQPQPRTLPLLTHPLCTTGCCCWSWPRPINNVSWRPTNLQSIFRSFLSRLLKFWDQCPFETFPSRSVCNKPIWILTFVNGSNEIYLPPHVTCHMACVLCHFFFEKLVELVTVGSGINVAYPV